MYPRTLHRFAEVRFRGTSTTKDEIAPSICFSFQRTNNLRIHFVRSHVGLERKLLEQNITPLHIIIFYRAHAWATYKQKYSQMLKTNRQDEANFCPGG